MKLWQFLVEYYWFSSKEEVEDALNRYNSAMVLINGHYVKGADIVLNVGDEVTVTKRYE